MNDTNDSNILEIKQRVTRVETRLIRLALALGVKLTDNDANTLQYVPTSNTLYLSALDTSLAGVMNYLNVMKAHGPVRIAYNGSEVATVQVLKT